jgi:transposase
MDRFHIMGSLNEAVDTTRKEEHRALTRQDDPTLARTKYLWLHSEGTLTDKQKTTLDALTGLELETAKVWAIKENFRQFFDCNGRIQRIKTNARGFRQFANFRVAILFFLGKLDIYPQTFR